MRALFGFVKTTLIGGLIVILPIGLAVRLFLKALSMAFAGGRSPERFGGHR